MVRDRTRSKYAFASNSALNPGVAGKRCCAFGAVKAWTEIASRHRVDLDTTIKTLADTGKDMNSKYKETSEAGLAANLVLC